MQRWRTYNEAFGRPDGSEIQFPDIIQDPKLREVATHIEADFQATQKIINDGIRENRFSKPGLGFLAANTLLGAGYAVSASRPEAVVIAPLGTLALREIGMRLGIEIGKREHTPELVHADEIREKIYFADLDARDGKPVDYGALVEDLRSYWR